MPERHLAAATGANLLLAVEARVPNAVREFRLHAQAARGLHVDAADLVLLGALPQRLLQNLDLLLLAAARARESCGCVCVNRVFMCVFGFTFGESRDKGGKMLISTTENHQTAMEGTKNECV